MVPEAFIELVEIFKMKYSITSICESLHVPRSTYYRWKNKSWDLTPLEQLGLTICKEPGVPSRTSNGEGPSQERPSYQSKSKYRPENHAEVQCAMQGKT